MTRAFDDDDATGVFGETTLAREGVDDEWPTLASEREAWTEPTSRARSSEPPAIVLAASNEPVIAPERRETKRFRDAHRAMAFAALGLAFGVLFAPLAMMIGQRARLATLGEPNADAGMAHTAERVGRVGFAVHLAIALTALPWILFMLPFILNG